MTNQPKPKAISTGPAIRAVCNVRRGNSCGSGTIVGISSDGHSYIMTNAHVVGTQPGAICKIWVESTGDWIDARIIAAGYSNQTSADWSLLITVNAYNKVDPVKMAKTEPSGSHYTKGFPRCRQHKGTDITTVRISGAVWFWEPDAIGGQSGSGVYSDDVVRMEGLLTWQWGSHGAGQTTASIYRQATSFSVAVAGFRPEPTPEAPNGLVELSSDPQDNPSPPNEPEEDYNNDDRGFDVEEGFFSESSNGLASLLVWWDDDDEEPGDPDNPVPDRMARRLNELEINKHRQQMEFHKRNMERHEAVRPLPTSRKEFR